MNQLVARSLVLVAAAPALASAAPGNCSARASTPPMVVELYTSEGCSSCPPADRWLSTLKGRPDVLALSFHVTYWDKLGWPDRFASPAFTERQRALVQASGGSYVYTPQVIANGQDWRDWPKLPAARRGTEPAPALALSREGAIVTAEIGTAKGKLSGYWAFVEDGHMSQVRAGENKGETLRHDHVVRRYEPVAAWAASEPRRVQWTVDPGAGSTPHKVVFVVTDGATQQPVQALALEC